LIILGRVDGANVRIGLGKELKVPELKVLELLATGTYINSAQ
jgi:hypothetical protein